MVDVESQFPPAMRLHKALLLLPFDEMKQRLSEKKASNDDDEWLEEQQASKQKKKFCDGSSKKKY